MSNICGNQPSHTVWEWKWPDGSRYIGWGVGWEPWLDFRPAAGTELVDKLASCDMNLDWSLCPRAHLTAPAAAALAALLRSIRRREGFEVLAGRVYRGSRPAVPACGCRSLRALARQLGCSRRQASKYAGFEDYDGRNGCRGSDFEG